MNMIEKKYSPAEVAELSGASVDSIRDWRRRGLLDGFGEQKNGRWHYSLHEILNIAIARLLEANGQPLTYALWMGSTCLFSVLHKVTDDDEALSSEKKNYYFFWRADVGNPTIRILDWELQYDVSDNLADIEKANAPSVFVVDAKQVAAALSQRLLDVLTGAE